MEIIGGIAIVGFGAPVTYAISPIIGAAGQNPGDVLGAVVRAGMGSISSGRDRIAHSINAIVGRSRPHN